jgi:hypothetical protein
MALFPNIDDAVFEFRSDRINSPLFAGYSPSNAHIGRMLRAAEADAEDALKTYFGTVEVLPDDGDQATRDALDAAGTRWLEDPNYDMSPTFFHGDHWGFLSLRFVPVQSIVSISFVYPLPYSSIFTVPADWIRLDKKYGHVNLVPGQQPVLAPLSAWVMAAMAAGRTIPRMIQVRYRAGIANVERDYPQIIDLVFMMAQHRMLRSLMKPGSESVSADGLSQSRSQQLKDWDDAIKDEQTRIYQRIHGVQVGCL